MGCAVASKVSVATSSKSLEDSNRNRSILNSFGIGSNDQNSRSGIALIGGGGAQPTGSGHHNKDSSVHQTSSQQQHHHYHHNENVQDEARSFRSKVSAIKMLARQQSSFESFMKFLDEIGKSEYLICFRDIEEIKKLEEDQIISRTYALVFRYKALYEDFKMSLIHSNISNNTLMSNLSHHNNHGQHTTHTTNTNNSVRSKENTVNNSLRGRIAAGLTSSNSIHTSNQAAHQQTPNSKHLVWDCLGKLKSLDYTSAGGEIILKYLNICENDLISRLVMPFETYLQSHYYKTWQDEQLEIEKQRKQQQRNQSLSSSSNLISPRTSSAMMTLSNRPNNNGEKYSSNAYPDILIVDDSNITLKITGKTLEQDGHHVEKANNGQIALQLMKSRNYDVVLIDCNMPVMDGFEAVQLFRDFERQNTNNLYIPSDVSSISDSQEDPFERAQRQERNHQQQLKNKEENRSNKSHSKGGKQQQLLTNQENTIIEGESENNMSNHNLQGGEGNGAGVGIVTLQSEQGDLRLDHPGKLKRGLTAAHYHQLIIGMSTNIDEETKKRALDAGMDFFLPKPFTLQKFIDTIKLSRDQRRAANGSVGPSGKLNQTNNGNNSQKRNSHEDEETARLRMKLSPQHTSASIVKESERSSNATTALTSQT